MAYPFPGESLAGSRLGPYEIVAPIGAGGMGEVWRGRDSRIGREVAPDGTATRIEPLPPMPDPKKRFQTPALSPDGKRFAGATGQPVGGGVPGMWLYELETKRYEQLSADRGFYPQWLPDGKRLLFLDGDKAAVIDVATKQIRPIPFGRKLRGFELSPDAHALILFERTSEADIWLVTSK